MNKRRISSLIFSMAVLILAAGPVPASGSDYCIEELITLSVGESQQREFKISNAVNLPNLRPITTFVIIAAGTADVPAGDLTVTLETDPELDFGGVLDYALAGSYFSLDEGPGLIYETASTPFEIEKTVSINSTFGVALTGALITGVLDYSDVEFPVPFVITFSLAEQEASEE